MGNDSSKNTENNEDNKDLSIEDEINPKKRHGSSDKCEFDEVLTREVEPVLPGIVQTSREQRSPSKTGVLETLRKSFKTRFSSDMDESGTPSSPGVTSRLRASFHELRRSLRTWSFKSRETSDSLNTPRINAQDMEQLTAAREVVSQGIAPKLINGNSNFASMEAITQVERMLPEHIQGYNWILFYSLLRDGASFATFFEKVRFEDNLVVFVQTLDDEIFGSFSSTPWESKIGYFGTGESWVFKVSKVPKGEHSASNATEEQMDFVRKWEWTGMNNYYMHCTETSIGMGGGGDGFAFYIGDDFIEGTTAKSETYCNDMLASSSAFRIANIEIWGFTSESTEFAARISRLKQLKAQKRNTESIL